VLDPIELDANGEAGIIGTLNPGDWTVEARYHDDTGVPADFIDSQSSLVQRFTFPVSITSVPTPPPALSVPSIHPALAASCTVPKLKGLKLAAAKRKLARAHCKLGKVTRKRGTRTQRGKVIKTKPAAGRKSAGKVAVVVGK